ncbi:MAG TPA: hypothetical protein H9883_03230 [Candidatus Ruthenibacterium merdigallinarum]|nr:hypothetical protein [Candidatus Ruthenibacterium merdigallinarum]
MARIADFALDFIREPLRQPFGFKGGSLSELWQVVCRVELDDGRCGYGVGVQSVLWSDGAVFCAHTQTGGNALMLSVTERALQLLKGEQFTSPPMLQKKIFDAVYAYAKTALQADKLSATFVLNALVPVDFALWQLWAAEKSAQTFDSVCADFCPELSGRQHILGEIPLLSYHTSDEEIRRQLADGAFLLKIKLGAAAEGGADAHAMSRWDAERLRHIHELASAFCTPYTECGHPVYYLDANGRYPDRAELERFLEQADGCGALERVILLEEPFAQDNLQDAAGLPVRVAGDESAHCAQDAKTLIDRYHYGAIALKPVAKTLSATLEIYREAHKRGVPCFCADLTVPPAMLEWNMQVAARLETLPGLHVGVVESNGPQNYPDWARLRALHPVPEASWLEPHRHIFRLPEKFYACCAAFLPLDAYAAMLDKGEEM